MKAAAMVARYLLGAGMVVFWSYKGSFHGLFEAQPS